MNCRAWIAGFVLLLAPVWALALDSRVVVLQEDSSVSRQTAEVVQQQLALAGWQVTIAPYERLGQGMLPVERDAVWVALGPRAFAAAMKAPGGRHVIGALISQGSVEGLESSSERWSAIMLDQPLDRWVQLIQLAFPKVQELGLLSSAVGIKTIRGMEKKMQERKLVLTVETIRGEEEVMPALDRLMPRVGLLLAMPDPLVHNRNTVQPLLLTTYRAGIPVVAYSEAYLQAGAVLVLYSSYAQIATQVRETLVQLKEGKTLPNLQSPRHFTVGVNTMVARSLGLSLPAASELNARLHAPGQ